MKTESIVLKETVLNNNCPECYAQESLHLAFIQEKLFSKFSVKTNKEITPVMNCQKCNTTIYPGRWTEDIERVYEYHRKTVDPLPSGRKFTGLFYALLIFSLLLFAVGILYGMRPDLFDFM